ncbi:CbtA family protein [Hoyosella altamirensis]|nr:CbtA family protein [Hoyosella altamirensis]
MPGVDLRTAPPVPGSFGALIGRGAIAGIAAGVLAGSVAFILGEPHIDAAIAIEEAQALGAHGADGAHSHGDDELVSRTGQKVGLFLATSLTGMALGAIFGTVAHYARRVAALSATPFILLLTLLGWLAIAVVPFGIYPANPPAVGDPDTINQRTLLWLAAVGLGIFACVAAVAVNRLLETAWQSLRVASSAALFAAIVGLGYLVLPTFDDIPGDFPAALLWDFRVASFVTTAVLWASLGIAFAVLTERAARKQRPLV